MSENVQIPENPTIPVKRGRGRPKGSLNRITKVSKGVLPTETTQIPKSDKDLLKLKNERLTALLKATNAKYNTLDAAEYQSRIEHMNLTDLQDECMRVGLKPNVTTETKNISIGTLMDLFNENRRAFLPDESGQNKNNLDQNQREKLLELMKSAR